MARTRRRTVTVRQEVVGSLFQVTVWVAHCGTCGPVPNSMSHTRKDTRAAAALHRALHGWRRRR